MPYTVAISFDKFLENIELSGSHEDAADTRKDRIVELLKKDFDILEAFPTGSVARDTAVRKYADLDIMVVLNYGKHAEGKKPSVVLKNVRDSLGEYKTNPRRNGQAVTLSFQTWPSVDIVPVYRTSDGQGGISHYNVPDMNREVWIKSRPKTHTRHINEKTKECGMQFKNVIKMIKWWNHQHSSLLESFHIEVMALRAFSGNLSDYSWGVFMFFDKAVALASGQLRHEGSYVDDYLDVAARKEVVKRLETARDKSRDAWYETYGDRHNHEQAIEVWRQIFGGEFPAYGS